MASRRFMDPESLCLGFDRYQRFRAAAEIIDGLTEGRASSILDVGGFDAAFTSFVPEHTVHPWEKLITKEGGGLPLPDAQMDICLALDVLEHVKPEERAFFMGELSRVADKAVLLGFPVKGAEEAEAFVLKITGSPWLAEHQALGLPCPQDVERILRELGLEFTCYPNASLASWVPMMLLMYGVAEPLRGEISRFFNASYYASENRFPCYRHIYLCRKPQS